MMRRLGNLFSRWLHRASARLPGTVWTRQAIVAGCVAGLLGGESLRAESGETPGRFAPGTMIYPQGSAAPRTEPTPPPPSGSRAWLLVVAVALGAGGVWILYRRRAAHGLSGSGRSLLIEETRSLGNRQYLVIASCEGRRFLLGLTPGRIELVAPLHERKREEDV